MDIHVTNEEKQKLWEQYRAGCPDRVPVHLGTNDRVYLLDPRFNTEGLDYRQVFEDAEKMLLAELRWQELVRTYYHRYCDYPVGQPDKWTVGLQWQNVYEAWFFGCPVHFAPGQVPATTPILTEQNKRAVFDVDITRPFARDPFKRGIGFTERMLELARSYEYRGRPVEVVPYLPTWTDGPLTVAANLRGSRILEDLVLDPDYADELLAFLVEAAIIRIRAFLQYWGKPLPEVGLADDMIEAIGVTTYRERVLPHHRHYCDALDPDRKLRRSVHLCGDASRHFPTIVRELGVCSLDTGFPVDLAVVRKTIGPEVEILGGVEVGMLLHGTSQAVYARAREILTSGVLEGRRFILREANNLPPGVPPENLAAMYEAALAYGRYDLPYPEIEPGTDLTGFGKPFDRLRAGSVRSAS